MPRESRDGVRRRRRATKTGVVLTEQLIVDTAIAVIRMHGSGGLSARRLGLALGADPSAVYRYFPSIEELKLAVADELIGRSIEGWVATGDWRRDLQEYALRLHASHVADPEVSVLAACRVTGRPNETAAVETVLRLLRTAGFPDDEAARLYRVVVDLSLAFAALDAAELTLPQQVRENDAEKWRSVYAHLPAAEFPHIAAVSGQLVALAEQSAYPLALSLTLDGFESMLDHHQAGIRSNASASVPRPDSK